MNYEKNSFRIPQYEYASTNQFGDRFKEGSPKFIRYGKLYATLDNAFDLKNLILLSDVLGVPVRYDFSSSPQKAYIEIVGKEAL